MSSFFIVPYFYIFKNIYFHLFLCYKLVTGFTVQGLYYSGSLGDLNPGELRGQRFSASLGLKELAYAGFNLSYSPTDLGFNVYGIGASLGFSSPSPTGISFNINFGNTIIIER